MKRIGLMLAGAGALLSTAWAAPAMARDCGDLAHVALPDGKVTAATLVPAGRFTPPPSPFGPPPGVMQAGFTKLPAFCRVELTMAPTPDSDIKVEVWLPASGWNGKFVGIGNGVWAGTMSYSQMGDPLARGFAVAATDTGHVGDGMSGAFAVGHPEKLVDFGHRAVHVMTVTGKRMASELYGRAPRLSLWTSCSTGGRQGLMEAYRYPRDYDAISAMAPANPMTDLMTQSVWTAWANLRTPASRLNPALLGMVHAAYMKQCDGRDGLVDGIVANPAACRFDPAAVACKPGEGGDTCLSPAQVTAVRDIYNGPRDPRTGRQLLPGFPAGSELQLAMLLTGTEPFPVATSYFRDLVFAGHPNRDWRSFDYARDMQAGRAFGGAVLDVPAAGLRPFFARGGKLLLSHGWSDGLIPANNTLKFQGGLTAAIPPATRAAALRLFMIPGMDHCAGGTGAWAFDVLGTLDSWAEGAPPPERIVAARPPAMPGMPGMALPAVTRPLCAWPKVARYKGAGDQADAANFTCT